MPTFIPREIAIPRTRSDELTGRMQMLDHRMARQDGPPDLHEWDESDTEVDVVIVDVWWK